MVLSKGKRAVWFAAVEGEEVCVVCGCQRGRGLRGLRLSKGKRSAWFAAVEGEEVCVVCGCRRGRDLRGCAC